jgi:hypothetical protein
MGRGVSRLNNAQHVLYLDYSYEDDSDMDQFYWEEFKVEIMECFNNCPSLVAPRKDKWDGRETIIILENSLAEVGIAEYCGLVSVSIRPRMGDMVSYDDEYVNLGRKWIDQVWPGIIRNFKEAFPTSMLTKLGTFSNGEAIYQKI